MSYTEEIGAKPLTAGQVAVNIDASTSLILPTHAQRTTKGGILQVNISVEAQSARWRYTTAPTTTNGVLVTAPGLITIRGEQAIKAFRIIGTVAGGSINYEFSVGDQA